MAYPQGSTITKSNMISDFNTLVITARNNSVVWHSTNSPFYPNLSYGTLTAWDGNPLNSQNAASAATSDLSSGISASEIYNLFINRTVVASQIRNIRLIKYLNRTGYASNNGDVAQYDVTSMSSVLSTVAQTSYATISANTPSKPASNTNIAASGLDSFIAQLVTQIDNAKAAATGTYTEFYCHSSCHASCHSSRGRR